MTYNKRMKNDKLKFSDKEIEFLHNNEVCRVATISLGNIPHIVPVAYIFEDGFLFFATDYNTKKYRNLKENKNVALVVDIYDSPNNKAVVIQGTAQVIEKGKDFRRVYELFNNKFEWVRQEPWKEGESPFIAVKPFNKISWGIN